MKTLKYWYITEAGKGCIAHGIVHGHQRLADGIQIHTSVISAVTVVKEMAIIKTKNSEYYCKLKEASFHLFDERGRDVLADFEKLQKTYERRLEVPGQRDGALIALDGEAEYYFVGAAFRYRGEVQEIRVPTVHLGMFQDSVLIEYFAEGAGKAIDYRYFPFPGRIEFYSWMDVLDTYIVNAGMKKIKVAVKERENVIEPGSTMLFPASADKGICIPRI